ncbi:electron transport complex subunit D [Clostridia bacterium]|nr:electron transport complex subunit D [Clostridia bacterium]
MERDLIVSSSPHIRGDNSTRGIMFDVLIPLLFPLGLAAFLFGPRVLILTALSVASCVLFEWLYRKLLKKSNSVGDMSAVVTGMLLVFTLPASAPYWIPIVGAFFAIVVVKQLFGGLGQNFMNPALAARAFLFSWPAIMTTWPEHGTAVPLLGGADAVSVATPLKQLKDGDVTGLSLPDLFIGQTAGSIGEISVVLLLLGGIYLWVRGVITPRIPLAFIFTVAALTFAFAPDRETAVTFMLSHVLSGGLVLGAIFMATDYATSPVTRDGQILFGVGCGALTVFIRFFGSLPEGVCYAILIMNTLTWLLDKAGKPKTFGTKKVKGGGGNG